MVLLIKALQEKKSTKVKLAKSTDVPSFNYVKKLNAVNGGKASTTPEKIAEFWKGASRFLVFGKNSKGKNVIFCRPALKIKNLELNKTYPFKFENGKEDSIIVTGIGKFLKSGKIKMNEGEPHKGIPYH